MPTPTVTTTITKEIQLTPTVRRKLLTSLRAYAGLKDQMETLKHAMDKHKDEIGKLRESTGEQAIALEGFKVTQVNGVRSVLNKQKLVELGCAVAWITEATEAKPNKPFTRMTCPGDKEHDNGE